MNGSRAEIANLRDQTSTLFELDTIADSKLSTIPDLVAPCEILASLFLWPTRQTTQANVFEFLQLPQLAELRESELEQRLVTHMRDVRLELI